MKTNLTLVIGPPKTGTTWLYHVIRTHPSFEMCPIKEIRFWDEFFKKKSVSLIERLKFRIGLLIIQKAHYRIFKNFPHNIFWILRYLMLDVHINFKSLKMYKKLISSKTDKWKLDISPQNYVLNEETIKTISDNFKDVKIVMILRNPVERGLSHLNMSMGSYLQLMINNNDYTYINTHLKKEIFEYNDYSSAYKKWSEYIPASNIFIGYYDDIENNPEEFISSLADFLAVSKEPFNRNTFKDIVNKSPDLINSETINKLLMDDFKNKFDSYSKTFPDGISYFNTWKARYNISS